MEPSQGPAHSRPPSHPSLNERANCLTNGRNPFSFFFKHLVAHKTNLSPTPSQFETLALTANSTTPHWRCSSASQAKVRLSIWEGNHVLHLPRRPVSLSPSLQMEAHHSLLPPRGGWVPKPLEPRETLHSEPNFLSQIGVQGHPKHPVMFPSHRSNCRESPRFLSLFQRKSSPWEPQKFIPCGQGLPAWEINTSVSSERKGLSLQTDRPEM